MTAFEVALPDGLTKKMILRRPGAATLARNPRAAADEFTLLRITQTAGLATQTPYHLDQSGTLLATPCLVLEYVEGRPEFAPADLNSFILQFATHLAAIHQVDCSNSEPGVPAETSRRMCQDSARAACRRRYNAR